jgi:hypothetical protein
MHSVSTALATLLLILASPVMFSLLPSQFGGSQPAQAFIGDWLKQITPTGLYFQVEGKSFYFGEYSERGDDAIIFKGSKWEVKVNGKVAAHGYGNTPGWVRDLARKYFGW